MNKSPSSTEVSRGDTDQSSKDLNPYRATATVPARVLRKRSNTRWQWAYRIHLLLTIIVLVVGMAYERIEHESIVASGASVLLLGLFGLVLSRVRHSRSLFSLGCLSIVFSLGIFLRIFFEGMSPQESERQHWILIQSFGAIMLVGHLVEFASQRRQGSPADVVDPDN